MKFRPVCWLPILLCVSGSASAAPTARSFAAAFFISRDADGSVEVLGTAVTWLLLCLSAGAVGLAIAMATDNRRSTILPEGLVDAIRGEIEAKRYREAMTKAAASESFLGRILSEAMQQAPHGWTAVVRALEQASEERTLARLRRIEVLNIIGQVSPMIGLFGTVYGMILAFSAIVASGGAADPVMLAGGIGTALTTTFWGLVVAIPSLAACAMLRGRIDAVTAEATLAAEDLLGGFRPRRDKSGSREEGRQGE
ncbi:MAG: MotA/TolQ/ExbB proton channel family protein [Planctomycetes bacterium]|nr:MotA/TolQ/ExbB proton channel family protein [Planctomycetota bacterium]MCP4838244.1 MotA/TolQ/ExbB proton channel family protein [Planctomycetota bacterium]